jgi:hypothetical protein
MILPNLIIAGAPKCGTTSFFEYLSLHPEVCASSKKETYYLMDESYPLFKKEHNYLTDGLSGYQEYFSNFDIDKQSVIMEATPDYLYQNTTISVLAKLEIKPKIIFILRKPSARIYSMFQFARNNMATIDKNISFRSFIEMMKNNDAYLDKTVLLKNAIEHSRYENYLSKWTDAIGESNIKIYLFEDMISRPQSFMYEIADYLGIDKNYYNDYKFNKSNETYEVKNQWMHIKMRQYNSFFGNRTIRKMLKKLYYAYNLKSGKIKKSNEVKHILSDLDELFSDTYSALEDRYNIDLSLWR